MKTRFAPSPTGYLHIGGARTALFSWLYAKKNQGKFVLRIEDTDTKRSTKESVNVILESMEWLGLNYDEGPFYQTDRIERYKQVIQTLLEKNQAYYCYASTEELETMRADQKLKGKKPRYDGRYRDFKGELPKDIKPVIRFKNPLNGEVVIDDLVKGKIKINNSELDDLIISRSDGTPTYNLSVVVDDLDMEVTHVIRGDDHLNNTPRQINILKALGVEPPKYSHIPMVLGEDGSRLSKRHGAVSVLKYKEEGYLPEALLNYLARLGWSHSDQEIFTINEMIEHFSLEKVNSSPSTFDTEKLLWVNHQHIQTAPTDYLASNLIEFMPKNCDVKKDSKLEAVVDALRERSKTLVEMANNAIYFYKDFNSYESVSAKKHLKQTAKNALIKVLYEFEFIEDWSAENIHRVIKQTAKFLDIGMGKVGMPLRVALTGGGASPAIDVTAELIGKKVCIQRINKAIKFIESL